MAHTATEQSPHLPIFSLDAVRQGDEEAQALLGSPPEGMGHDRLNAGPLPRVSSEHGCNHMLCLRQVSQAPQIGPSLQIKNC